MDCDRLRLEDRAPLMELPRLLEEERALLLLEREPPALEPPRAWRLFCELLPWLDERELPLLPDFDERAEARPREELLLRL